VRATLTLHAESAEELTGPPPEGAVVVEVRTVLLDRKGEFPGEVDVCYIERLGPLSALDRLGREPDGIPLCVYVRPSGRETNPKGV
jgi:hypothetical protein